MPTKTWVVGEEVLAADFNAMVQRQIVATFPNAAGRTAAVPSPAAGMITYLADVNTFEYWNGTAWRAIPGPGMGQLAYKFNGGTQTGITNVTADIAGLAATVTVPAGRRIQLTADVAFNKAPSDQSGYAAVQITDGSNSLLGDRNTNIIAPSYASIHYTVRLNPSAGANTWKLRANTNVGFLNVLAGSSLTVEDVGPSSMPT